jgi:diadenosine tetraphosphate (Ap4A) HIT family hydrolase
VEEGIRHVMQPDKVNIAALGNMVPHIHWHIIPRFKDDAFYPGSVWSQKIQETPVGVLSMRKQWTLQLPDKIRAAIANLY